MKVYLVVRVDWDESLPIYAFSSKAEADKCLNYKAAHTLVIPPYGWQVEELELEDLWKEPT